MHDLRRDRPGFDWRIKDDPRFGIRLAQMIEILDLKDDVVEEENDRGLNLVHEHGDAVETVAISGFAGWI